MAQKIANPLLAFGRPHAGVQDAHLRCSLFQSSAQDRAIVLDAFKQANKRAAFGRQRECHNNHFASVSWTITETFSSPPAVEISPVTSFTPGREESAFLNSGALFSGISTSTWVLPLSRTPFVADPGNFVASFTISSATEPLWPCSVVSCNPPTPSGGGVRAVPAAFSRDFRRCSRACPSSNCRFGFVV